MVKLKARAQQAKDYTLGAEPTLIIQAVDAALNVIQVTVITMPTWLHGVIAAVLVGSAALLNRQVVTPLPPSPVPTPPSVQA